MAKKSIKNITKSILEIIADIPRVFIIGFSRETLTQKMMMMELGFDPFQINKTLKRLTKQEYMNRKLRGRKETYYLAQRGVDRINFLKFDGVKFDTPSKKWDGYWRVVVFDIPEEKHSIRDALRNKLRQWEFYKLQHSVFVCPLNCEKEVGEVTKILGIGSNVLILKTSHLGYAERRLKKYFRIN